MSSNIYPRRQSLDDATRSAVRWLNQHGHPHMRIIVGPDGVELVEGVMSIAMGKDVDKRVDETTKQLRDELQRQLKGQPLEPPPFNR